MPKITIKPFGDRVLVEAPSEEDQLKKTKSGILLPDTADKEKIDRGKVIEVGPGKINEAGKKIPISIKKGQTVIFSEFGAEKIEVGEKEYYLVSESNILAILE